MTNKVRGEVEIDLGGSVYTVALDLGTLAEIEAAFGVDTFEQAFDSVLSGGMKSKPIVTFIEAAIAGSGVDMTDEVKRLIRRLSVVYAYGKVIEIVETGGMISKGEEAATDGAAPLPDETAGASG